MYKRYVVRLTHEERKELEALVRRDRAHARKLLYGRILLKTDASEGGPAWWTDERIAQALETNVDTVARQRRRFVEDGLEVALMPKKPAKPRRRVLDGRAEARLVALAWWRSPARSRPRVGGALDLAASGRPDGEARARRGGLAGDRKAHAQKTNCALLISSRSG